MFAMVAGLIAMPRLAAGQVSREPLRLDWRAPAGCPSGRTVRDAAIRSSGSAAPESSPLEVRADVEHAARWRVTIQSSRNGAAAETRSLEAASCSALAEATAVMLGVALIPGRSLARPASDPAGASGVAATNGSAETNATPAGAGGVTAAGATAAAGAAIPPVSPPASAAARAAASAASEQAGAVAAEQPVTTASPRDRHLAVAAEVAGDAGVLPAVAGGARVALAWTPRAFRLEVSGAYFSGQSRTTEISAAGARFGLLTIGGRGCWAALRVGVEVGPCGGVDVQHMTADGFGAPTNFEASGTWAAATLGALVRVPLTRYLALRGDIDGVAPFTRPRFVVENDGAVHKPAGIGARAAIGAELNFL